MTPPTLQTARLTLRPHRMDDWPALRAFLMSDHSRYMDGPYTAGQAWGIFCSDILCWELIGHGALAVDHGDSFVGQVSLNHPPHFPEREIGWATLPGHQGQGYATEAARCLLSFAWDALGWDTCVSYVDQDNAPSRRVAEKLGGQPDPDAQKTDPVDVVYRHLNPKRRA